MLERKATEKSGYLDKIAEMRTKVKQNEEETAELENQRIVQIVQVHSLDGTQLKAMLANIKTKPSIHEPTKLINLERKNENEENN